MKIKSLVVSILCWVCVSASAAPHGIAIADAETGAMPPGVSVDAALIDTPNWLISKALSLMGVKYRFGGRDPEQGLDCSGFVSHVFRQAAGVVLPPNAYQLSRIGTKIATGDLKPGDLVFYQTMQNPISHVGIYLGGNKFIHAPRTGKSIEVADMGHSYWARRFQGARRVATPEPAAHKTSFRLAFDSHGAGELGGYLF